MRIVPTAAQVGHAIIKSCAGLRRGAEDMQAVASVYDLVGGCVKMVEPAMSLYVFGSTAVYGFREPGSDVDLVALSASDVADGTAADATSEIAKSLQADFLARLAKVLRERHGGWNVDLVRRTRVPVLRVKGGSTGVDFDITAFRRNGVRNSALLRAYFAQLPQTRLLSVAVKSWSKRAGVNTSVGESGCITSYGLNLMLAYYLLRRGLVSFVAPASCSVASVAPLPPALPLDLATEDGSARELGSLTQDFLHFYLDEFDAAKEVVSLSRPERTTKEMLQWTTQSEDLARIRGEKVHYCWCIEDPYEHNLNVGRKVTSFKLLLLRKHLERAVESGLLLLLPPPPSPSSTR